MNKNFIPNPTRPNREAIFKRIYIAANKLLIRLALDNKIAFTYIERNNLEDALNELDGGIFDPEKHFNKTMMS